MNMSEGLRNLRLLVVDDDNDTREMLRFILEQEGAHVTVAASVAEALESYRKSPPSLVVADIGMPEQNGYALISMIRDADRREGRSTPAIALTAYTSPADEKAALNAGFQKYLAKPFEPAKVIETIRELASPSAPTSA
jgi:CheY-like chemotaxis protein